MKNTAIVVVDVQNDFLPGGALAVPNGDAVIDPIAKLLSKGIRQGAVVAYTADFHPRNHASFKEQGGAWPAHCVQFTHGSRLSDDLWTGWGDIYYKGYDPSVDSYSGFGGQTLEGTSLFTFLAEKQIKQVIVVGLALDYCVKATAIDAVKFGFKTSVYTPGTKAVNINSDDGAKAIEEMVSYGVKIVDSL